MNPVTRSRRESVCRSLFGPVDREQLRRELKLRLGEVAQEDSRRWNFDFRAEAPLPGGFQWEEVPADRAAAFYRDAGPRAPGAGGDRRGPGGAEESAASNRENCPGVSNAPKTPAEVTPGRRKRTQPPPPPPQVAKPRDNARITDFFAKRRRTSDSKRTTGAPLLGSSEAAPCKTIR